MKLTKLSVALSREKKQILRFTHDDRHGLSNLTIGVAFIASATARKQEEDSR